MGRSPSIIAKNSNSSHRHHKNNMKMTIATTPNSTLPMSRVFETWTDKMTHSTKDLLHDDDDEDDDDDNEENLYMTIICRRPPSLHRGRSLPALWKLKAFSEMMALTSSSFVLPRHSSNEDIQKKKFNDDGACDNDDCDTTSGSTAGGDDDDDEWLPPPPPSFASSHSIITSREDMEVRVEELRHRFRTCSRGAPQHDCCGH